MDTETQSPITNSTTNSTKDVDTNLNTNSTSGMKIHPPLLAAALLAATLILHFILPENRTVAWHHVIGLLIVAAGVGICVFPAAVFQARDTTKNPYGEPAAFVVQPPYTFTRNPMYLGLTTALAGFAIFFGSIVMLAAPAIFAFVIDGKVIPREEATMERLFGQQYLDYKNRVRRWL
ncbi:MAG: isoprenylcysteine carboxylmethyltransferase family protein [Candidatus Binatus sp.]|uniref:methyltransferase family protein n=1 Tax=Candidatus Binatus sp. TaxID=2811406 RepID=UPI002725979D|nr:isoprenylcysteine carboxylmethyltransferase family protein [Candidatus Binatus sp.]MDO8430990.1 isoprenylcysteine carboxylmethyltransferase family protein [Candidatus Binatus sp.]